MRGHRGLSCLVQPGSAATIFPGAVAWCELNQGEKYKFRMISQILWNQLDWKLPSLVGNWNVFYHFCRQQITTILSTTTIILIFCSVLSATTGISGRGKDQTTGNTGGNGESGLLTIVAKIGQRVHRCPILSNIPLLPMLPQVSSTSGEDGSGEDGDEKSVSTVEQTTQ